MHLHAGRPGSRRLTSIGHSDSSGRSSPTEDQRHGGRRWGGEAGSEFRVGEAVRCTGNMKSSTSLPHFSSGKDSGFEEAPVVGEDGHNTGGGRGGRAGGAFIVSGVFNDSSRMFIPAPPSPTPDYDDGDESDGNDSDILQGSQFCPANEASGEKKRVGNRDSLSDDSLHNAPIGAGRSSKASTPIKNPPTPLQNMMKEFHQGLPPVDHENGFSDDSLEDSTAAPSRPSTMSQNPHHQTSVESLASMESSTASFDYMNAGQARSSAYEKSRSRPSPTTPVSGSNSMQKGNNYRDRKDVNGKVKKSSSRSTENIVSPRESVKAENGSAKGDSGNFNRQSSRDSSQSSGSNSSKPSEKFDTIRHMLKEGLIEGLDESPPQFKPPPVSKEMLNGTQVEDRADSGLGSIFSTTRTDESGASDLSNTPPSLTSPQDSSNTKNRREKETVRSRASIASEDIERNRDEGDEVEVQMQETLEIPPPPPPRDESMHWTPKPPSQRDPARHPARSVPSTPASSKNPSWLHNPGSGRDEALDLASSQFSQSVDKITHVDDLYGQQEQAESGSEVSSAINGSLASHYSTHDNDNPLTDREFLENLKNLEPRPRPDTLAVITEDQGSLGSRSSRSGRLLSRIADSVRSGSRTPTPSSSAATTRATTTKLTSTSRSSTRIHGDIIREPWRSSVRESALPSPQEYSRLPSLSPSVVPLTRDGSGRFRSIEDIAEAASSPAPHGKKKKHSTLPPNLTPADIKKENKELRRATSLMVGKKAKVRGIRKIESLTLTHGEDGSEGSKFRFNFFRGFWRRKQYSFDNKV